MKRVFLGVIAMAFAFGALSTPTTAHAATEAELRAAIIDVLQQLIAAIEEEIDARMESEEDAVEEEDEMDDADDDEKDEEESTVSTSASVREDGGTNELYAELEITFSLKAFGDNMYIPLGASLSANDVGVLFSIEDPDTGTDKVGLTAGNIRRAYLESSAEQEENSSDDSFYRIDDGDIEEFTLYVAVDTDGGAIDGAVRLQAEKVRYTGDIEGSLLNYDLQPKSKYETGAVTIED